MMTINVVKRCLLEINLQKSSVNSPLKSLVEDRLIFDTFSTDVIGIFQFFTSNRDFWTPDNEKTRAVIFFLAHWSALFKKNSKKIQMDF